MRSLDQYYRSRSLWLDGVPGSLEPRPSLPGDIDADVAIIGAGYTAGGTHGTARRSDAAGMDTTAAVGAATPAACEREDARRSSRTRS